MKIINIKFLIVLLGTLHRARGSEEDVLFPGPESEGVFRSRPGDLPFMAAVYSLEMIAENEQIEVLLGGGSIIHQRAILTAAHLLTGKTADDIRVEVGTTVINDEADSHVQIRRVRRIRVHPRYNARMHFYNLAVIELDQPLDLSADFVAAVQLPETSKTYYGLNCTVAGWGTLSISPNRSLVDSAFLRRSSMRLVQRNKCARLLRRTMGSRFELHTTYLCALGVSPGNDACQGNGGAPLVCYQRSGLAVQVGVVSWGIGCGMQDVPGIYADVTYMTPWLKRQIKQLDELP